MKNLAIFFATFTLILFCQNAFSQKFSCQNEIGVQLGFTTYSGDVAKNPYTINEARFGFGAFYRHHFANKFAVRGQVFKGLVTGDDKNNPYLAHRKFKFSTDILEVTATAEWHPLGKPDVDETGLRRLSPYVFAGVGYTRAQQNTEAYGSREEIFYNTKTSFPEPGLSNNFISTPFGAGVRMSVARQLIVGVQGSFHPVYSDHLDGVSVNATSRGNDWYYFLGMTISYILNDTNPCKMF